MSLKLRQNLVFLLIVISQQTYFPYNLYQLSPSFPPIAYLGQYYTCTFRVNGLSQPLFTFSNLPQYLLQSSMGTIQGIPSKIGSFTFTISYQQEEIYASQDVVLRVAPSTYNITREQFQNVSRVSLQWIDIAAQTIFQVGDSIDINLAQHAKDNNFYWYFMHIPQYLKGTSDGQLKGIFNQQGFYSFAAVCLDKYGNARDYFFTFNIQSINQISMDFRAISTVPSRNIPRYNISYVFEVREQAVKNVEASYKLVKIAQQSESQAKKASQITLLNRDKAIKILGRTTESVQLALKVKQQKVNELARLKSIVNENNNKVSLKQTFYQQTTKIAITIKNILDNSLQLLAKLSQILSKLTQYLAYAQGETAKAASKVAQAQRNVQLAEEDVNITYQVLIDRKQSYSAYLQNLSTLQFDTNTARTNQQAAAFQNDKSHSYYKEAEANANGSLKALVDAKKMVSDLQAQKQDAKSQLGAAQFNLTAAMNNLFVAQAAKEQADKSITLLSLQNKQTITSKSSKQTNYIFYGCQIGNYPIISGTASIIQSIQRGFVLSSGYTLMYGECSGAVNLGMGDTVQFKGYIRSGVIQGIKLDKK